MKEKFIVKYMMLAKEAGTRFNPCFSRHIGIVIVDPVRNAIISTGYNGPPEGTPHCDTEQFLREYFWPQLTDLEKELACKNAPAFHKDGCVTTTGIEVPQEFGNDKEKEDYFIEHSAGKRVCPRRYVGAGSGERTTLCSCAHAERNAIIRSPQPVHGMHMFCWCGVPCMDCASAIVQSGIDVVHCLKVDGPDYFPQSRWMLSVTGINLREHKESDLESYDYN